MKRIVSLFIGLLLLLTPLMFSPSFALSEKYLEIEKKLDLTWLDEKLDFEFNLAGSDVVRSRVSNGYILIIGGENHMFDFYSPKNDRYKNFEYDVATEFYLGYSVVNKNAKYGLINSDFELVIPCEYDNLALTYDGYVLYLEGDKYGLFNTSGEIVIPAEYESIEQFSEDLAIVRKMESDAVKVGYVDKNGSLVIPCKYDNAYAFRYGVASVQLDGKWGIINKKGEIIMPFDYDFIYPCSENSFLVNGKNDSAGLINKDNDIIIPFDYDDMFYDVKSGLIQVQQNVTDDLVHNGFFDTSGKEVIPCIYDGLLVTEGYNYDFVSEGLITLKKDGKWGVLNTKGEVVIPFEYEHLSNCSDGRVVGYKPQTQAGPHVPFKWTCFDKSGRVVFEKDCMYLYNFSDGVAVVHYDFGVGVVDKDGKDIMPYNEVLFGYSIDNFYHGVSRVSLEYNDGDTLYGYINKKGEFVVPPIYTSISEYSEDFMLVNRQDKDVTGVIKNPFKDEMMSYDYKTVSPWAAEEVYAAIEAGLVPHEVKNDFKLDITRQDFAKLLIPIIEKTLGKNIEEILVSKEHKDVYEIVRLNAFDDTRDKSVIAAKALGIINGKSEKIFDPDGKITREQAAALLERTAKYLGYDKVEKPELTYSDVANISNFAKESVAFVGAIDLMKGVGDNKFEPKSHYTKEQAMMTIYRLYFMLNENK